MTGELEENFDIFIEGLQKGISKEIFKSKKHFVIPVWKIKDFTVRQKFEWTLLEITTKQNLATKFNDKMLIFQLYKGIACRFYYT